MRERLHDACRTATSARRKTLHHDAVADMGLGDDQIVDLEVVVVLGVRDRRFQALLDVDRDPLALELQVGERRRHLLAADQSGDEIQLLRADAQHLGNGLRLIVGKGIVMKRFAPRGRGRSGRVFKPFAQLTIVVRQVEAEANA